jgi:hypothetical protein
MAGITARFGMAGAHSGLAWLMAIKDGMCGVCWYACKKISRVLWDGLGRLDVA